MEPAESASLSEISCLAEVQVDRQGMGSNVLCSLHAISMCLDQHARRTFNWALLLVLLMSTFNGSLGIFDGVRGAFDERLDGANLK